MEFFLKKQNGVVTIMISLVLVAIMSSSSLLMEIARYRSQQAILEEITDSASFSMLSEYDKDLWKRFGLLAISDEIDQDEFVRYLRVNSNAALDNPGSIETMFQVLGDESSLEGIYALNDISVLQRQIAEFSKYRVPVDFVKEVANLEGLVDSLKGKIKELLPLLNVFQSAAKIVEKVIQAINAGMECNKSLNGLKEKERLYGEKYNILKETLEHKIDYLEKTKKPEKPEEPEMEEIEMPETLKTYLKLMGLEKIKELVKEDEELEEPELDDFEDDIEKSKEEKYEEALALYQEQYQKEDKEKKNTWEIYRNDLKKARIEYEKNMQQYQTEYEKYEKDLQKYEDTINQYNENLKAYKNDLLDAIGKLKEAIADYDEKNKQLQNSYSSLASETFKGTIEREKQNYKEELDSETDKVKNPEKKQKAQEQAEEKLKNFENMTEKLKTSVTEFEGVFQTTKEICNEISEQNLGKQQEKLSEYYNEINSMEITELKNADVLQKKEISLTKSIISNAINQFVAPLAAMENLLAGISEGINKMAALADFMLECSDNSTFDISYNVTIKQDYFNALPSRRKTETKKPSEDAQDKTTVIHMLDDAEGVSNLVNYDISTLYPDNRGSFTEITLQEDIEHLQDNLSTIVELVSSVKGIHFNIVKQIVDVIRLIGAFIDFIGNLIQFCKDFLAADFVKLIYRSFLTTQYAVNMFPDRTTAETGETLKGNSYSSFKRCFGKKSTLEQRVAYAILPRFELLEVICPSAGQLRSGIWDNEDTSFAGAELEYIYCGSKSEAQNQRVVYSTLFFLRYLLNIVPCAMNNTVRLSLNIPFVGVLVLLLWVGVESYLDLKILTLFKDGVPIVKMPNQVYLSAEGMDDLVAKFEDGFKNLSNSYEQEEKEIVEDMRKDFNDFKTRFDTFDQEISEDTAKKEGEEEQKDFWQSTKEDFLTNLQEFTYTEHMNLLLFFVSDKKKLQRIQDLIQMEMDHKRKQDGKLEEFKLDEAYTYVRAKVNVKYQPILPMPSIPGANGGYLKAQKIYYSGY